MTEPGRGRPLQLAVLLWCLVSAVLALLPVDVGGVPRAVNSIVFMMFGPGVAMATLIYRRYARPRARTPTSNRSVTSALLVVVSGAFSLSLLVLASLTLLLTGLWSVWAVVSVVSLTSVVLLLWPIPGAGGAERSDDAEWAGGRA